MKRIVFLVVVFTFSMSLAGIAHCLPKAPTGLRLLATIPKLDSLSIENISIDASGNGTATLYLNTTKTIAGAEVFVSYNASMVAMSDPIISPRGNSLAGLIESNLNYVQMMENFTVTDPDKKSLVENFVQQGNAVSMTSVIDTNVKTGKIPLCDLRFTVQPGQTRLVAVTKYYYDIMGVRLTETQKLAEAILNR